MEFVNSTNQCLTEAERGSKALVQNVTEQLLGFVCYKEGDRIACECILIPVSSSSNETLPMF